MSVTQWLGRVLRLTDGQFLTAYFGASNSTGKSVTRASALSVSAAWACIRLLHDSTQIIPMSVYRKRPDGGREAMPDHPAYYLVHERPNEDMTPDELWAVITAELATNGNALLFPLPRVSGAGIASLEFVPWRDVQVRRNSSTWALQYVFNWRGKTYEKTAREVIHYRGFGFGDDVGLSAIRYGANTLGIAMAADDFAGRTFRNGSNASGFITTDKTLKEDQRKQFRDSLSTFRASDDVNKMMLLEGGFKWEGTGINPNEQQMLETRGFSIEQVCALFRVPPFMIGHTEKSSSYPNSLEQQVQSFLTFALDPYLTRIEKRTKLALLSPADRAAGVYTEFNREALMRIDSAARAALYSVLAQNGILTRNEIRDRENMPRKEGGDDLTVQSAMVRLQDLQKMVEQGGSAPEQVRQALINWLGIREDQAALQSLEGALRKLEDARQSRRAAD